MAGARKSSGFEPVKKTPWPYDLNCHDSKAGGRAKGQYLSNTHTRGRAALANAAHGLAANETTSTKDAEQPILTGLSHAQWQALVKILNDQKENGNERMMGKEWIINTGATNHMIGNIKYLHGLIDVRSCPVGLPNRQQVIATKEGTTLAGGITLKNVLCAV